MSPPIFTTLEIETQGDCNRTCGTCLRQSYVNKDDPTHEGRMPVTSMIGKGIKMPTNLFKSIIDQSVEFGFTGTVNLQHFNEPLLDERLKELALYVKSKPEIKGRYTRGCKAYTRVNVCTNMDLITEERAESLDGVIDFFRVALYMPLEKQPKREQWIKSLFKKSKLYFTKGVHVATHYTPTNLVDDYGRLVNVDDETQQQYGTSVLGYGGTKDSRIKVNATDFQKIIEKQSEKPCTSYNETLYIAYNGTVLQCCDDYVGHFNLGNVKSTPIKDVWESETYRKLVADISQAGGRRRHSYCASCPR